MKSNFITVETTVEKSISEVWELWTNPKHIVNWNFASPDWHTPLASNDLQDGGKFSSTMAAKDGSVSFEFCGMYEKVIFQKRISSLIDDGRKMSVEFEVKNDKTHITEKFEPEKENSFELQQAGWQAILNNFKKYAEKQ